MILASTELMDVVNWSRAQFALTAMYHWLFVPLTLGLGFIVAFMHTNYYRTRSDFWKRTTKFWMRIFGINFAIGVATGLILEFEFGTNWSNYSHFVGDIFGAPLAIEGIMAFFMESTFIAVMFFGWNRVSKGFHLAASWLTAFGANLSALWILVANAWMQSPVGTVFNPDTARNEMTSFWDVLLSPVAINKFTHTVTSGFVLAAIVVMGISAWYLLRGREQKMAVASIKIAAIFGLVSSILCATTGDGSAYQVAQVQPMKLAAMEGLYDGEKGAGLSIVGLLKPQTERTSNETAYYFNLRIPTLLSRMSYWDSQAYVAGVNDLVHGNPEQGIVGADEKIVLGRQAMDVLREYTALKKSGSDPVRQAELRQLFDRATPQGEEFYQSKLRYFGYSYLKSGSDTVPNVPIVYYSFRVMVGLGLFFILLFMVVLWAHTRNKLTSSRWLQRVMLWSIPLVYISSQAGWVVAEMGRQPWTIQDLMPSVAAVSRINSTSVIVTFCIFAVLFTTLLIAELMIITRQVKIGPGSANEKSDKE